MYQGLSTVYVTPGHDHALIRRAHLPSFHSVVLRLVRTGSTRFISLLIHLSPRLRHLTRRQRSDHEDCAEDGSRHAHGYPATMASFGDATVHEVGSSAAEPAPAALPTVVSAAGSDYEPKTPLEAKMAAKLREITAERTNKPKFAKIQLQFPKVAAAFQTVRAAFNDIDADKSGTIELSEMVPAMAKMGATVTAEEVTAIFEASDDDGNKKLDFQEFLVFLCVGTLLKQVRF